MTDPASPPPGANRLRRALARLGPLLGLLVVWSLFAWRVGENFIKWDNQRLMLLQTSIVGTAAVGATLVIVSGGIDLSVGSTIALGTVVIAILLQAGVPPLLAALGGIACGALVGLLIGTFVTGQLLRFRGRVELSPFIVTLALWGALRGLAKGIADNQPVYVDDESWLLALTEHGASGVTAILAPAVWIMLAIAGITALMLRHTRFGRHVFAIGSNEQTARLCGVRVERRKLAIYAFASACAGVAAMLQFSYIGLGDPTTATGLELSVIAAVVIGGASLAGGEGSILGTLVGALIMTVVANGCTKLGWENWVQEIVTGAIIVVAVTIDRLRHR